MNFLNNMMGGLAPRLAPGFDPMMGGGGQMSGPIGIGGAMDPSANASPEREAMARKLGYRSFDEMMLRERMKRVDRGNSQVVQGNPGDGAAPPSRVNPMGAHPKTVFEYITNVLRGANNK